MNDYVFSQYYSKVINVKIYAIDACNYNCEYCYNKRPRCGSILDLTAVCNFLSQVHIKFKKYINIEIIGGEPTLHPNLIDFCKKIHQSSGMHCSIYSNFSASTGLYLQLLALGIGFTWSFHSKHHDFASKLDEIPFEYYSQNNINIRIMFEQQNFNLVKNLCLSIIDKYKDYFEPAIVQNYRIRYSSEYLDFYNVINSKVKQKYVYTATYRNGNTRNLTVNMAEKNFKNFKYWLCYAGLEYFYIHANGNVYSCINQYERAQLPTCNINSQFDNMPFKPMVCTYDTCPCIWEVHKKKVVGV